MREGSLEAPTRHAIPWRDPDFTNPEKLDAELRRVFDICHGCRRCFNLCDSFPRLFDLIDDSESGELDTVDSAGFKPVVDACTLCDMCFMTKCPYVPPHEFDLDFPHLMLRYRTMEFGQGKIGPLRRRLNETDSNGKLAGLAPSLVNWASDRGNKLTRPVIESVAGIHRDAELPKYHGTTFAQSAKAVEHTDAIRKTVLYATCFVNYNNLDIGAAALAVLAKLGVETEIVYPACCGMPQLEHGDISRVAETALEVAQELCGWIDKGYDVIGLVPSCTLMLKFEWPLIQPDDPAVAKLAKSTFDINEYVVDIAKNEGLPDGMESLSGDVALHLACHARAQNMGPKAAEMLRLIPDTKVGVIERCSGHGGAWGVMKENFDVALKVGRPAARQALESGAKHVVSECPLAREHILQGMERLSDDAKPAEVSQVQHPIQLMAKAYQLDQE